MSARISQRVDIVPNLSKADRINAARLLMPRCHFDRNKCALGLSGLREWSFEYDDERKVFSKEPRHDWASHPGDGFSYGAVVMRQRNLPAPKKEIEVRGPMTIGEMVRYAEKHAPKRARI